MDGDSRTFSEILNLQRLATKLSFWFRQSQFLSKSFLRFTSLFLIIFLFSWQSHFQNVFAWLGKQLLKTPFDKFFIIVYFRVFFERGNCLTTIFIYHRFASSIEVIQWFSGTKFSANVYHLKYCFVFPSK